MDTTGSGASLTPDYLAEDCGPVLRRLAIGFMVAETICVGLRYLSKRLGAKNYAIDDILIVPGWLAAMAMCITSIVGVDHGGIGRHVEAIAIESPMSLATYGKIVALQQFIYTLSCLFPRLALLTLYLKLFALPFRRECIATWTLMACMITHAAVLLVAASVACVPLNKLWEPLTPGHCNDLTTGYRWATAPNVFFDVCMILLPLPAVWKLQKSWEFRAGVTVTIATGSVGMVTAIVRTVFFFTSNIFEDPTWTAVHIMTWTIVETGVYVIAACLPSYRQLLRFVIGTDRSSGVPDGRPAAVRFMNSFVSKKRSRRHSLPLDSIDEAEHMQLNFATKEDGDSDGSRWSRNTHATERVESKGSDESGGIFVAVQEV